VRHFLPVGQDPSRVTAELDAEELDRLEGVVEIPGAAALLRGLEGARVAVVTSASRELARRRMLAAGVQPPRVIVAAEDVEVGKPSPEGYRRAASLLGVPRAVSCSRTPRLACTRPSPREDGPSWWAATRRPSQPS
jgi:sugar-phosphatase